MQSVNREIDEMFLGCNKLHKVMWSDLVWPNRDTHRLDCICVSLSDHKYKKKDKSYQLWYGGYNHHAQVLATRLNDLDMRQEDTKLKWIQFCKKLFISYFTNE